jgi:hypothetical protein
MEFKKRKEALEILGICYKTLYKMADNKEIDTIKIGKNTLYNVNKYLIDRNVSTKEKNKDISLIVEDETNIYEKKIGKTKLDTLSYLELQKVRQYEIMCDLEVEKTRQLEIDAEKEIKLKEFENNLKLKQEVTKQLQLQLEILKLKTEHGIIDETDIIQTPNKIKNLNPRVKKCIDCETMITKRSQRCSPCVNKKKNKILL